MGDVMADRNEETLRNRNCVVRKSRIHIPSISLSPRTKNLIENNDKIMRDYGIRKPRSKLFDWIR